MRRAGSLVAALALALGACRAEDAAVATGAGGAAGAGGAPFDGGAYGSGVDPAVLAHCAGCHTDVVARLALPSSHHALFDCLGCHATSTKGGGPGHASTRECAACHSEAAHPAGARCGTCHDAHGTPNAFLVNEGVPLTHGGLAYVRVTKPEGASADGLARAGVKGARAGTGLCEVCHDATKHYDRDGLGAPHDAAWCGTCHDHAAGFASPPDAGAPTDAGAK